MKKIFKLENLDCANCANKIQESIKKIDGVEEVSISFMTQKMILQASDELFDKILLDCEKAIKKVSSDVEIKFN